MRAGVGIKECVGFAQRADTACGETYAKGMFAGEPSREIAHCKLVGGTKLGTMAPAAWSCGRPASG